MIHGALRTLHHATNTRTIDRVNVGLRHIAFFVVPSAVAFLTLGDVVAAALFQTGRFTYADAVYVWAILAGSISYRSCASSKTTVMRFRARPNTTRPAVMFHGSSNRFHTSK